MSAPRRLRRQPLERTSDPLAHQSGLPTQTAHGGPIHPSPAGPVGLQGGESISSASAAFGPGTAIHGNYEDGASPPKGSGAPQHPLPFELHGK